MNFSLGRPAASQERSGKKKSACSVRNDGCLMLGGPEDVEFFFDVGEVLVAGGEGRFALEGESGGETIGVRQFVLGAKFGGGAGQFEVGVDNFQGELSDVLDDFPSDAGAFGAPGGVVHFAPIHHGHQ